MTTNNMLVGFCIIFHSLRKEPLRAIGVDGIMIIARWQPLHQRCMLTLRARKCQVTIITKTCSLGTDLLQWQRYQFLSKCVHFHLERGRRSSVEDSCRPRRIIWWEIENLRAGRSRGIYLPCLWNRISKCSVHEGISESEIAMKPAYSFSELKERRMYGMLFKAQRHEKDVVMALWPQF